ATNTLMDQGQNTVVSSYETGGTLPYTYNFLVFNSISNVLVANELIISTNSFAFFSNAFWTSNSPLKANVIISDSATPNSIVNSISITITVNSPLSTAPSIAVTNTLMDQGQNTVVSSYETGGTLPYTYNFLVFNSISNVLIANELIITTNSFA